MTTKPHELREIRLLNERRARPLSGFALLAFVLAAQGQPVGGNPAQQQREPLAVREAASGTGTCGETM